MEYYLENRPESNRYFIKEFGLVPLNVTFIDDATNEYKFDSKLGKDPIDRVAKSYVKYVNQYHCNPVP